MNEFTKPYFDAVAQLTAPTAPFEIETVDVAGVPLKAFKNAETSLGTFLAAGRNHGAIISTLLQKMLQASLQEWQFPGWVLAPMVSMKLSVMI